MNNDELKKIAEIGKEYGSTTNRMRKVNWLNLDKLIKAINITGTTCLIISKVDVLDLVKLFKLYYNNSLFEFDNLEQISDFIEKNIRNQCNLINKIIFSDSPNNCVELI